MERRSETRPRENGSSEHYAKRMEPFASLSRADRCASLTSSILCIRLVSNTPSISTWEVGTTRGIASGRTQRSHISSNPATTAIPTGLPSTIHINTSHTPSSHKKCLFFLRGFQMRAQNRPICIKTAILAEESGVFSARIAAYCKTPL